MSTPAHSQQAEQPGYDTATMAYGRQAAANLWGRLTSAHLKAHGADLPDADRELPFLMKIR